MYKENPDGSIDIELTLYFKPQSYFYLGIIISGTTLILCLGYLGYVFYRKRGVALRYIVILWGSRGDLY